MLQYVDVETFVSAGLTTKGYDPLPFLDPGPDADAVLQDQDPDMMVMLVVGTGPGLSTEELFDRSIVHVRSVGQQMDYTSAEKLAQDVDNLMVAVDTSQFINNKWTLSIVRSGGPPAVLLRDDGDRYHFTCNYIWEVQYE